MRPRIDIAELGLTSLGEVDPRTLASEAVQAATTRYEEAIRSLSGADPATVEVARLRNAFHQQCFV